VPSLSPDAELFPVFLVIYATRESFFPPIFTKAKEEKGRKEEKEAKTPFWGLTNRITAYPNHKVPSL